VGKSDGPEKGLVRLGGDRAYQGTMEESIGQERMLAKKAANKVAV